MKTRQITCGAPARSRNGSAVIAVLLILSTIFLLILANARATRMLAQEVRLIEQRQIKRLKTTIPDGGASVGRLAVP